MNRITNREQLVQAVIGLGMQANTMRGTTVHAEIAGHTVACRTSASGALRSTWGIGGAKVSYADMMTTLERAVAKAVAARDERTAGVLAVFRGHKDEFAMLRGVLLLSTNWSATDALDFKDQWVDSRAIAQRMDELNREAIMG
jgi:hypothetical protein